MKKLRLRKPILISVGVILVILLVVLLLLSFPRPIAIQELHVGDSISGYRNMNCWNTFSCLTSCHKIDENIYDITITQYYNNNQYDFNYVISQDDFIYLYSSKIPRRKTKLRVTVNSDNKSIILENEELLLKEE